MLSLNSFVRASQEKQIDLDAVMVIQDGITLGLQRLDDMIYHNVFSIAKSFLVTGIGMAVDEGLLSLEDKPVDMFKEYLPEGYDKRWDKVTLIHLMTMTSGHGQPFLMAAERKKLKDVNSDYSEAAKKEWLVHAFSCPMSYEPGEKFSYGNLAPYVAGRMLEKAVGMSVCDYLYQKLWEPMHVKKPHWGTDPAGHTFPASDLYLDIADMIKLGELYLKDGVYEGRRYLSSEWVQAATGMQVDSSVINPPGYGDDELCGYGYYFWHNSKGGFRAYGREGQFVIVLPEKKAVIATQAMHHNVQDVLDLVWEHIEPQL